MIRRFRIILLLSNFQFVTMQEHASRNQGLKCDGDPPIKVDPKSCCHIPPLFNNEDFQSCGVEETGVLDPYTCVQRQCLMKTRNLLYIDDDLDKLAIGKFLDVWAENNSLWKNSIAKTKEKCLADKIPITEHMCDANKQMYCISASLFQYCANWNKESEDCSKLRGYVDLCIYYYMNLEK